MGEATLRADKVVGFHFFYPASMMPLVEVIVGEDTSRETATAAYNFAQAIKKQPIVCGEVPGFVVNRILMATIGEIWRAQEDKGLSLKAIDEAIAAAKVAPMGPFFLTDLLGLDTVLHVAEHLSESYGESFYVHQGLRGLVADGKLGAKSGGEGFFKDGEQTIPGDAEPDARGAGRHVHLPRPDRVLPAGRGGRLLGPRHRPRDDGRGRPRPARGLLPPFWKADVEGLGQGAGADGARSRRSYGERFAPPVTLRRLVAQGRLGIDTRPGLLPLPAARRGRAGRRR